MPFTIIGQVPIPAHLVRRYGSEQKKSGSGTLLSVHDNKKLCLSNTNKKNFLSVR
jgi:hypothetical protein